MAGGNASQSGAIGCFDAILGLEHNSSRKDIQDDSLFNVSLLCECFLILNFGPCAN